MSQAQVAALHDYVAREARAAGAEISAFFVCPHRPDEGCRCRKPAPGLVLEAIATSGISAQQTVFIGDAERDVLAGRAASVSVALVRTGKAATMPDVVAFEDLLAATRAWLSEDNF